MGLMAPSETLILFSLYQRMYLSTVAGLADADAHREADPVDVAQGVFTGQRSL